MEDVDEVEVVVAHHECATLRVGEVFLKIDADQRRTDVEVEAMAMAPIPTPQVLWRKPPVLALAALPGKALGRLGEPSTASPAAWAAAGAAVRKLHDAPLPPWPGRSPDQVASHIDGECEWLITNGVLPADVVTHHRRIAEAALRPWTPVFTHGDLQVTHIRSVVDWVARRLAIDWLLYEVRAAEGIFTVDECVTAAGDRLATEAAKVTSVQAEVPSTDPAADPDEVMAAFRTELATGIGTPDLAAETVNPAQPTSPHCPTKSRSRPISRNRSGGTVVSMSLRQ